MNENKSIWDEKEMTEEEAKEVVGGTAAPSPVTTTTPLVNPTIYMIQIEDCQ